VGAHALNCRLGVKGKAYTRRKFTGVLILRSPSVLCGMAEAGPAMIDCRRSDTQGSSIYIEALGHAPSPFHPAKVPKGDIILRGEATPPVIYSSDG